VDYSPIINQVLKLWWVVPILLAVGVLQSPWFKGIVGESFVKVAAKILLRSDTYHHLHNVTLPTADGTTQIDHVFVSRFGIFVVETKNMKGWIFGTEHDPQWTQNIFGTRFKFQNPLRQNYKHVKVLEASLDVPANAIHSVVVFSGQCTLKSPLPANVTRGLGLITYIKSFRQQVLSDAQVEGVVAQVQAGRLAPSFKTARQHVQNLASRNRPDVGVVCPRCGSQMVLRTARQGPNAGNQFWGCSEYPRCKAVQSVA
jgi:restriction system protein